MGRPLIGAAIGLVKIPGRDSERPRDFHRDVLGLTEEFAVEEYGWEQSSTGTIPLCLYLPGQGGGDDPDGDRIQILELP